jgi:hypothetical protein
MGTRIKDVALALDTRLSQYATVLPIVWENVAYKPNANTSYIRPTLIPAPSDTVNMENVQRFQGIYQIDLFTPANAFIKTSVDTLDEIYDHFKENLLLTHDNTSVIIRVITLLPFRRADTSFQASLQINWDCYSL